MAWKAFLKAVTDNPVPNDTVDVEIEFREDVSGKTIQKSYNFHAENLQDLNTIKAFVLGELAKLNQFDSVRSVMESYIGKEIK